MQINSNKFIKPLLFIAVLIEFFLTVYIIKIPLENKKLSSIIYFISGISIGLLFLLNIKVREQPKMIAMRYAHHIYYTLLILIFGYFIYQINLFFYSYPLNYKWADMLPIMKIMAERFIHNENPYNPIYEIWNGMEPIYLPAMWILYSIPIALKIDIRWINIIVMLFGIFLFLYKSDKKIQVLDFYVLALVAYFLIESLHHKNQDWYILTEEPLIVGYYLILAFALFKNKPILIGIAISLCLLSRYILLFWFIGYLLYVYKDKVFLKKLLLTTIILSISLFVITQAYTQIEVFLNTPKGYINFMSSSFGEGVYNTTIKKSLGIAKFFKITQLGYLHSLSMIFMLIVPIYLFYFYRNLGVTTEIKNKYAIGILKLSLVFFLNMLIIPMTYLFITSTLFSIALLSIVINKKAT